MPRPTIGGITMVELGPFTSQQANEVKEYRRKGLDGVAFTKFGKSAMASVVTGRLDIDDAADLVTQRKAFYDLSGTATAIVDISGTSRNVVVKGVREVNLRAITNAVGGENSDPDFVLDMEFIVIETDIS